MEKNYSFIVGADGFVFRLIDKAVAEKIWDLMPVFGLDDDGQESEIQSAEDLERYDQFGLDVEFATNLYREVLRQHASVMLMYTNWGKPFYCDFELNTDPRLHGASTMQVTQIYQANGEIGVVMDGQDTDWDDLSIKEQEQVVQVLADMDCLGRTKYYLKQN